MMNLSPNWLTEGLIDVEYKRYVLLAYLQHIGQQFHSIKLYPHLAELVAHYQNLVRIQENKNEMQNKFPEQLTGANLLETKLVYTKTTADDHMLKDLEEIITFSIPEMKKYVEEGKDIYEYIEKNMEIMPIGIESIYKQEGYLLIPEKSRKETLVYEYQVTLFTNATENFRAVRTNFLETATTGLGYSYETLKVHIARKYKKMGNPSTYLVACNVNCPLNETILPIAKRLLVRHVSLSNG